MPDKVSKEELQITAVALSFSSEALERGKVTPKEATDLITRICEILDVPFDTETPEPITEEGL